MNATFVSYIRILAIVAFIAGIFLVYPGDLFFLNDDFTHLYLTSKGEWLQRSSFRPICDLSMWTDHKVWGLNATGFHITNVLLHLLSTYLVFLFAQRLLTKYHNKAIAQPHAILVAAIFFVYCFHSETVFWIIGRSASLGTIFFLLSMVFYFDRKKYFLLSLSFFAVGLITYESVIIIPGAFLILSWMDVKQKRSTWKVESKYFIAAALVITGYFVMRYFYIHQIVGEYEGSRFLNFDIPGLARNGLKLILRSFSRQSGSLFLLGLALAITITSVISFLLSRNRILVIGLVLLWLVSYMPYLSLGIDTFGSEGERYLYLPSVFLAIIIGLGIVNATKAFKYIIALLFFAVQLLLLAEFRQEYQVASAVTKATVEELKRINAQTIYIKELPEENNGAVIFRTGIEEACKLYCLNKNVQVKVLSAYKGNYQFFSGTNQEEWTSDLPGEQGKDAVLDYTNNILTVYR